MISPTMTLVQPLFPGSLDIIGDVHGERNALENLLDRLGYDDTGRHADNRRLVFIGDYCDRGYDSPGVIALVQQLVASGQAQAILGNHEINLLVGDAKDGSGWFFDSRHEHDSRYYAPFVRAKDTEKPDIQRFFNQLPLALERDDLRLVHAAWVDDAINRVRGLPVGKLAEFWQACHNTVDVQAQKSGLLDRYHQELQNWSEQLEDSEDPPPFLHAVAEYEALQQLHNPFKILTSGVEKTTNQAFFSGNRWRFCDRIPWWDHYVDKKAVVIGHYWRLHKPRPDQPIARYSQLFQNVHSEAWHGALNTVFCVDYSVGARWRERKAGQAGPSRFKLAALRWPEKQLVFDSGEEVTTRNRP